MIGGSENIKSAALRGRMAATGSAQASELMPRTDMQLLTELGYSAVLRGWFVDAEVIFSALEKLAPDNAAAPIGFGLLALVRGQFKDAIEILETQAVSAKVSGDEAKAILLLAYRLARRNADADRLQNEIERGGSQAARGIAQLFAGKKG